jgi:hypothetical protein
MKNELASFEEEYLNIWKYRIETAFDTSKVHIVQELHSCPVSKYGLILTNVGNSEECISLLMYMLIIKYAN